MHVWRFEKLVFWEALTAPAHEAGWESSRCVASADVESCVLTRSRSHCLTYVDRGNIAVGAPRKSGLFLSAYL